MASSSTKPSSARGKRFESPAEKAGYGLAGFAILLAAWEVTARSGSFGNGLPTVGDTLGTLAHLLGQGEFWRDTGVTVGLGLFGLVISVLAGVLAGMLIGAFSPVRYATRAITEFLKPIPPIVLLPLAVMIWGPTGTMALVLVMIGTVLSTTVQVIAGVQDTDPVAMATARSYGIGPVERLWRITLPSAAPYIGTSVRLGAPAALVIVVVAGLLGGAPGLGSSIYRAQTAGDYPLVYALVLVLGGLGLLAQNAAGAAEKRVLHWHPAFREVAQ